MTPIQIGECPFKIIWFVHATNIECFNGNADFEEDAESFQEIETCEVNEQRHYGWNVKWNVK